MSKVLLVASDSAELKGLDGPWDRCVSGVGPMLSAVHAVMNIIRYESNVVVSVGSAGSLGRFRKGDVVSFGSVVTPDQDLSAMHLSLGTTIGPDRATMKELYTADRESPYILYSSGRFSSSILPSHTALKADAADMEAYGVALAARYLGIKFYAVKLITDIVGDKSSVGDISFSYRDGRERLRELLSSILSRDGLS